MKAIEIAKFLDLKYPHSNAMEDDFIGLQVDKDNEVKKALICLDVTLDIIKKAVSSNVDLIISHHPLFFGEKDEIINNNQLMKIKYELLDENNISHYSLHTNIDFHHEGLSVHQGEKIGLKAMRPLTEKNEGTYGALKVKKEEIVKILKSKFELDNVNAFFNRNGFTKVAIASGASGYLIDEALNKKCDLLILGEVKWHEWVYAKEKGLSIIEMGHFTEKVFIDVIKRIIQSKVKEVISFEESNIYKSY